MGYRLGSVPYVNAAPLVAQFEEEPQLGVEVVYDVPSRLPAILDAGDVDAILVSSYYLLTTPGLKAAVQLCIGSDGPVRSVRLFSKVPFSQIRSLALDASSLTSSALAKLLLRERFGVDPRCQEVAPDFSDMLTHNDAALLIGDNGMAIDGSGMEVMDLGEEWTRWTGLPFVWALWVGRENMVPELVQKLVMARRLSGLGAVHAVEDADVALVWTSGATAWRSEKIIDACVDRTGLARTIVESYLRKVMVYALGEREAEGMERFRQELGRSGISVVESVDWVQPVAPATV